MEEEYFRHLREELNRAYSVAEVCRKKGLDPESTVEVKITKDVAARVEGIVGPPGVAEIIRKMEEQGMQREDVAFEIARMIAAGGLIKANREFLIEQAVRTGTGILTEGVLVAPTEGIAKVRIKQNPDGTDYAAVYYAGPIRSAGGTAAALSLVMADIARRQLKVNNYRATDSQVERYIEEINMYEARVTHLQYKPSDEDIRSVVKGCPVCIDGEPTEDLEVSAYRGVPGVETNRIRGGVPLVVCEGVAQKAAKLLKYARKLQLEWDFLEKVIKIKRKADRIEIRPDDTYLDGLVAGRPVFAHPSAKGGFRLRYGKSKTNGIMAKNIHPAAMLLLDNFLTYGTHMKIERPGKGCVVAAHEGLEPPVVATLDGRVMKVRTLEDAEKIKNEVREVLFIGDMLVSYGDFLKSNHPLLPPGYCREWWEAEVTTNGLSVPHLPDAPSAFNFSMVYKLPLHPDYTYHWHDISPEELEVLYRWLLAGAANLDADSISRHGLSLPIEASKEGKGVLEALLVEHRVVNGMVVLGKEEALALLSSLGILKGGVIGNGPFEKVFTKDKGALELVNELAGIVVKAKAPIYIGARMGRPEKAKEREMDGSPNVLFPTGSMKNRSLTKLYRTMKTKEGSGEVVLELARHRCTHCNAVSPYGSCIECGGRAALETICSECGKTTTADEHCGKKTVVYDRRPVSITGIFDRLRAKLGFMPEELKGVKGLSNALRVPERLEKGFLRARHDVYVFRDGTSRFDATDVPLSHFTPAEISLPLEKAIELGYETDYLGNLLKDTGQIVPLKCQDVILSERGAAYFLRVGRFVDELLINLYGMRPFYNFRSREDLIGHLVIGLSPHTSAGVLSRIIGFTKANVGYAHPYFHTAKRRNCDGDEDCLILLMDALLNFSRKYLTDKRGGTMDAPLVLTPQINPKEVDDEVHCVEMLSSYPLEFYQAAERITPPGEVKLKTVKDVLGSPEQYGQLPFTHPGGFLDKGNTTTAYVSLGSIPEKINLQFRLQEKLRAVDQKNAAERLVLSHFIPDLYGNLRSFSRQTFRCVNCNYIYRRPPLIGKCAKCGGNLLLTINKGGIQKYLEITKKVILDYGLPDYLRQRLALLEKEINSIFEDDKVKQTGIEEFL